jgi:hypothetical protein
LIRGVFQQNPCYGLTPSNWKGLGIITDDGWTKVAMSFDSEVGKWTKLEVIDTNGVKTQDVLETAGKVALTAFFTWPTSDSN